AADAHRADPYRQPADRRRPDGDAAGSAGDRQRRRPAHRGAPAAYAVHARTGEAGAWLRRDNLRGPAGAAFVAAPFLGVTRRPAPLASQHEPAGVDVVVGAVEADRHLLGGVAIGVEQDEGVGGGGEEADLTGRRERGGADEGEGLVAGDRDVG